MADESFTAVVKSVSREYVYENPNGQMYKLRIATVVSTDGDNAPEIAAVAWHGFADVKAGDHVRVMYSRSIYSNIESHFIVGITHRASEAKQAKVNMKPVRIHTKTVQTVSATMHIPAREP